MTRILAIDPGPVKSGFVLFNGQKVIESGHVENEEIFDLIHLLDLEDKCAIEMIQSFGMAVGKDVFETCVWIGRYIQFHFDEYGYEPKRVFRKDVKMKLCGTTKAKDANVRQALIDMFEPVGGGKTPQIGTKSQPGPLYGVSSHAWPALGVAVTALAKEAV